MLLPEKLGYQPDDSKVNFGSAKFAAVHPSLRM